MAGRWILDEVFNCSIKRETQSTIFMDTLAARALTSSHFTQPVANFVRTRMDKNADDWRLTATLEGYQQPNNVRTLSLPPPPSSSSTSLIGRSIAGTSTSSRRQRQKIKPNWRTRILPQVLIEISESRNPVTSRPKTRCFGQLGSTYRFCFIDATVCGAICIAFDDMIVSLWLPNTQFHDFRLWSAGKQLFQLHWFFKNAASFTFSN